MIACISLAAEVALALALAWTGGRLCATRLRIFLYRCTLVVAALAPLTLLVSAPEGALIAVPTDMDATASFVTAAAATERSSAWLPTALLSIWVAGALLVLARTAGAHLALSNIFARSRAPSPQLSRLMETLRRRIAPQAHAQVRVSTQVKTPCTFGVTHCKVLLPDTLLPAAAPAVLTHELCHIRARDTFWITAGRLACALYWFNPLIWVIAREHRDDIEVACDDDAVTGGVEVDDYVRALVSTAGQIAPVTALGAIAMSQRGLVSRVRSLLHRSSPMPLPSLTQRALIAGAVTALATLLAAGDLVSAHETLTPSEGNGLIYVRAGRDVEVRIGTIAMCGNGADCVFELPLGQEVTLQATSARGRALHWSGCAPSGDVCTTQILIDPVRVTARLR